jgi:hypothetical protein
MSPETRRLLGAALLSALRDAETYLAEKLGAHERIEP